MLSSVLNDPSTHDVTFKTSDGGSVGAHRVIVAAGSPVFHAMLYGNMKESNQKEIELPNVDTASLKMLLFFIYTGQVQTSVENCCYLLQAAHYFAIDKLMELCSNSIGDALNLDNFFSITGFAVEHKFDLLLKRCLKFSKANMRAVIFAVGFVSLPLTIIQSVTKSSKLELGELDLFLAVVKWSKYQQDKLSEDDIKSVFKQIRYPLIRKSDLLNSVFPTGIADPDLYKAAVKYLDGDVYDGPQEQLELRKGCSSFHSHEIHLLDTVLGTLITTREIGYTECLTEDDPTIFKIFIKRYYDKANVTFDCMADQPMRRFKSSESPKRKEVNWCTFVQSKMLCVKIGNKSMLFPIKDQDTLSFSVRAYIPQE